MDEHRFDQLARSLTTRLSRRSVTGFGVAGGLGLIFGQGQDGEAKARCLGPSQKCSAKTIKKARCCGGSSCKGTRCRCPKGQKPCRKRCCPKGKQCVGGQCRNPCLPGQVRCGTTCRNLTTDPQACGSCGTVCPADAECLGGECICPPGRQNCSGECVSTQSDSNNCGECGQVCSFPFGTCLVGNCCTGIGATCQTITTDTCCGLSFCKATGVGFNGRCCAPLASPCDSTDDCCSGICSSGTCQLA
jgi:hypothetical protein